MKPIVLTLFFAAALSMAAEAFAQGRGGYPPALEVFKDGDRTYVQSGNFVIHRIYIDGMSGVRWIDATHVILPFNNALQ